MDVFRQSDIVGLDCNLQPETLDYITGALDTPMFLDPVSASKADVYKRQGQDRLVLLGMSEETLYAAKGCLLYTSCRRQALWIPSGTCIRT